MCVSFILLENLNLFAIVRGSGYEETLERRVKYDDEYDEWIYAGMCMFRWRNLKRTMLCTYEFILVDDEGECGHQAATLYEIKHCYLEWSDSVRCHWIPFFHFDCCRIGRPTYKIRSNHLFYVGISALKSSVSILLNGWKCFRGKFIKTFFFVVIESSGQWKTFKW